MGLLTKVIILLVVLHGVVHVALASVGCPVTCQCYQNDDDVHFVLCSSSYWHTMPRLPPNTTHFKFYKFEFQHLPANAFQSSADTLVSIKFGSRAMKSIDVQAFQGTKNLDIIELARSNIKNIPANTFMNLTSLDQLHITNTLIKDLSYEIFCPMVRLNLLNLSYNRIISMRLPKCFEKLRNLQSFQISNNPLADIADDDLFPLRDTKLRVLSLRGCKMRKVSSQMFKYLPYLVQVDLSSNGIKYLPDDVFSSLLSLKVLCLNDNQFDVFNPTWIHMNRCLHTLHMEQNKIRSLNQNISAGLLENIKLLDISSNHLQMLANDTFKQLGLTNVQTLFIARCSLDEIEPNTFAGMPFLETLVMSDNILDAGHLEIGLNGLQMSKLNHLDCGNLKLSDFPASTFQYLSGNNITLLQIDTSHIRFLHTGIFAVFENVRQISLQNNEIVYIEDDVFGPLTKLKILNLQNNHLTSFPDALRLALPIGIEQMKLGGNAIKKVLKKDLHRFPNIDTISLSSNGINLLERNAFGGTPWITTLNLNYNRIPSLHECFNNCRNLQVLLMIDNIIEFVGSETFSELVSLEELDLSKNEKFGNVLIDNRRLFQNLSSLKVLHLDYVGLTDLTDIFLGLYNLTELFLPNNHIHTLHKNDFSDLVNLDALWLSHNKISIVPEASFSNLPSLLELYLSGNTFACNCDLLWFMQWVKSGEVHLLDYSNTSYKCASPDKLKNTPLLEYNLTPDMCVSHTVLIASLSVSASVAFITLIVGLIVRYRWYIRYYWFLLHSRRQRHLADDDSYHFDAFISYMHRDRAFVIEKLLPELEYRGGLRLCLHDRNWMPGSDIADNIIESIESSRRTVLVITNDFARSQWCQLELALAHTNMLETRRDSLVLILLEDINASTVSTRLRSLLTEKTYLSWSENTEEQEYFWEGLKRALLRPSRNL